MLIIGIILGIIIWQTVLFITLIITKENEDITINIGVGIWWLFVPILNFIYNLHKKYLNKKYPEKDLKVEEKDIKI